jgi:predicted lipoprotein with Yx(FWY)xxD motif
MRKCGWAAAAGLGSLVLLLTACGGSSDTSSAAGAPSSAATQAPAVSSSSDATTPSGTPTTKKAKPKSASTSQTSPPPPPSSHKTAGPEPSSNTGVGLPPVGTTVIIIERTSLGYVMAEANGQVVYTYGKDKKGGAPTCTGSCAATWLAATGVPKAGPADTFPGTFGLVTGAGGVKQITYNGYPLYVLKGAKPLGTTGNGVDGEWHVIPLPASDISGG